MRECVNDIPRTLDGSGPSAAEKQWGLRVFERELNLHRWLVTGASGQLGSCVVEQLARWVPSVRLLACANRFQCSIGEIETMVCDLSDPATVHGTIQRFAPTRIIHLAAVTSVAAAFENPAETHQVNVEAVRTVAESSADLKAHLTFVSTDMVFDGSRSFWKEQDECFPLSVYGRSKCAAEDALRDFDRVAVVRLPLLFGIGCSGRPSTFSRQLQALMVGESLSLFEDEFRTPLWLGDAARAVLQISLSGYGGVLHCGGPERLSRLALVQKVSQIAGVSDAALQAVTRASVPGSEPRPADLSLDSSKLKQHFPDLVLSAIDQRCLYPVGEAR